MLIPHEALILLADGKKFLLLRNVGSLGRPALIFEGGGEIDNPSTHAQGTDQPGRVAGYTGVRSAVEQTDYHQLAEDRFACKVADLLERLASFDDYEKLIVVAPPRTMARLRNRFGREVRSRIIAEIDKDLTRHPVEEVAAVVSHVGQQA